MFQLRHLKETISSLWTKGHKGSGGKVWRKYREDLAETGFTFEYSATFGQALAAANNTDLVDEIRKSHRNSTTPTDTSTEMDTVRISESSTSKTMKKLKLRHSS